VKLPPLRRYWQRALLALMVLCALLWTALAPLRLTSRDQLFNIPKGTWERRMKGDLVEILPSEIALTMGVRDVLLLRNSDTVPQVFGPVLIMPGQDFRLPFEQAGDYQFACTAHASGQMTVRVQASPNPGWSRMLWRWNNFVSALRAM
jgi:hypothetical protein